MGLNIQTNTASMVAQNHLAKTQTMQGVTFARLSSGLRINGASDDAAGLGISESLNAQVRSYSVAERNANDGISMAQTADGAASQIHDMLGRMRELAVQGSNGDLSTNDQANVQTEFAAVQSEIDRISNVSSFNGTNLLNGGPNAMVFQVGINNSTNDQITVSFGGADTTSLKVDTGTIDLTTAAKSQAAIAKIDAGIQSLSTVREGFGAAMNRFASSVSNIQSMRTNTSAALGRIRDVDVAEETAAMARQSVLSQAGVAVLAQANQAPQLALSLLRG